MKGHLIPAILVATLHVYPSITQADLVEADLVPGSGDSLVTRDTDSGLEWLDVTETVGVPFDAVLILQALSDPASMSDKAAAIVQQLGLTGIDFLDSAVEPAGTV